MPETPISSELNLSQVANTLERASNFVNFCAKSYRLKKYFFLIQRLSWLGQATSSAVKGSLMT